MVQARQLIRYGLGAEITGVDLKKPPQVIQGQSFATLGSRKLLYVSTMAIIFLCALLLVASTCVSDVQSSMCAEVAHRQNVFCEDGTYGRYIWSQSIAKIFKDKISLKQ